jgi:putative hydrolase of the HAD superfamily
MCNAINERTQKNIDADEMYLMVIRLIHDHDIDLHQIDLTALYEDMEQLVFEYLPHVYSPDTLPALQYLKNKQDTTLSILSNTGFIKGRTLRGVLKELGLYDFFDFQLYSDEEGLSKPCKQLFELVIYESGHLRSAP